MEFRQKKRKDTVTMGWMGGQREIGIEIEIEIEIDRDWKG